MSHWRLDRYRDELHTIAREIGAGPFSLLQTLASGGIKGAGFLDKDSLVTRGGPATYATALGRSHRSVQRWLAELVAVGLLVKVWTGGSQSSGKRMASRYRAVMPSDWQESADGTPAQTHDRRVWHGSDQGLSDRPTTQWRLTHDRVSHLPHEVRRRDGADAPPSGASGNGDDDVDLNSERVEGFDREAFFDDLYDDISEGILADAPADVINAFDRKIETFDLDTRGFITTDRANVNYIKRRGAKLVRQAEEHRDAAKEHP